MVSVITSNSNNKKLFRKSQPFWNDELQGIWKEVCRTEKEYLSYKVSHNSQLGWKQQLKTNFRYNQKLFDKKYRYFKRKHKKEEFEDLGNSASNNPAEMWAKLKKLCDPPSTRAALEVVHADGSISTDIKEILDRWYRDISRLFSGLRDNPEMAFNDLFYNEILEKKQEFENLSPEQQSEQNEYNSDSLNFEFSLDEVSKAINNCKHKKAYLDIPNEAAKNLNAKLLLHKFFNLCFKSGLNPTDWNFSDIKPIPNKEKDPRDPLNNRCITIMCCIAKMYSKLLNTRLQKYLDENNILVN